ncbi:uncharacterized protein CBL_11966 [Carabus blaptoides fortunei]
MALTTELLSTLDSTEEPLTKRLRIANNAFHSIELPVFNKEAILLQWFSKIGSELDTPDIWDTLNACLTSQHMKEIKQNEIQQDILTYIVKAIRKRLKQQLNDDLKLSVVHCAISILRNEIFQQYFRYDVRRYCAFVATVLSNIDDLNELVNITNGNLLFDKKIAIKTDYSKYFLSHTFMAVIAVLLKLYDSKLFDGCIKLVQRTIFPFNTNDFEKYLDSIFEVNDNSEVLESNNLIVILQDLYKSDTANAKLGFKLIFTAFWVSRKSQTVHIYQFFVLLLQLIGFKINAKFNTNLPSRDLEYDLNKSLSILANIFEVISLENVTMVGKINEITFNDCVKFVTNSIMRLQSQPSFSSLKIFQYVILIDPLIIDSSIGELIAFITLSKKEADLQICYSNLMVGLFEMYMKLHRVHKFSSELLRTLKNTLRGQLEEKQPDFNFQQGICKDKHLETVSSVREMFPESVVAYFHRCIILQSSKQVISIMRTLVNQLEDIVDNLKHCADDQHQILYIQIVSDLTCQFLSAVRIAEHTTTEITVNKFLKDMEDLKGILAKFGTTLLNMEHNHSLMFSFLHICYVWAEVAILLMYYAPIDNINLKGTTSTDNSASNITYLHSYLTAEQWSLVSQRIKNFGEQPCKYILQKLIIQKLRAMVLFESEFDDGIETAVVSNFSSNLETTWDIVLTEQFTSATIVPKMENGQLVQLAELLMSDILKNTNYNMLKRRSIMDCRDLQTAVFYVCLSKINSLFKKKRKHDDQSTVKPLSTKIFKHIDLDLFIRSEQVNLETIAELFADVDTVKGLQIDDERFCTYLEVLRYVPVCFLSHDVQITFFLYLLSICIDLNDTKRSHDMCLKKCEEYLIGLVENITSPNIFTCMSSDILISRIMLNTDRYKEILNFAINKALKHTETIETFKQAVKLLANNLNDEKYFEMCIVTLHIINKAGKYKVSEESKKCLRKYKIKLCKNLVEHLLKDDNIEDAKIEAFVLTLQKYLLKDNNDNLSKLASKLKLYIDFTVNNLNNKNTEGCLLLFQLVLRYRSKLENVPEDFILRAWKACKDIHTASNQHNDVFSKTVPLIFEHVSNDEFPAILNDALQSATNTLKVQQLEDFRNQLKIWSYLLNSSLNTNKQKTLHVYLQLLLQNSVLYLISNRNQEFDEVIVKLLVSIIENKQISQTPNMIDNYFQTIKIITCREYDQQTFPVAFENSMSVMEALIKHRKVLLIDRLPTYLLHLRLIFKHLCTKSNVDQNLEPTEISVIADCTFRFERLVKSICSLKKDMARIAPYLIADILKQFEKITFYSEVKTHLTNGLYHLIDLCDSHAVSYLLRVLSTASTELFKNAHRHYTKYYKFTGRV